jgi:hypothetical protein
VLYLARPHAHRLIRALCGLFAGLFLVGGHALGRWGLHIDDGYRRQLMDIRAEEIEQVLLREEKQLTARLGAELAGYPELHRRLVDDLFALEQDYRASTLMPPASGPLLVGQSELGFAQPASSGLHLSAPEETPTGLVQERSARLMADWRARRSSRERMTAMARIVRRLGPIQQLLERLQDVDLRAQGASRRIEAALEDYRALLLGPERRQITLGVSSLQRFLVGLLFGVVAIGGAALNFFLIERPMAEMVGEAYEIAGMSLPRAAALVMIMLEATAGIALMEFWGITRLVSFVDRIEPWKRTVLTIASFMLLLSLACIEAGLALVREDIIRASEATLQQLQGTAATVPAAAAPALLPMIVQATLGFIIPFLLALIAIPLELLLTYGTALLAWLTGALLTVVGLVLRFGHRLLRGLSTILVALYDVLIFLPLAVERLVALLRRPRALGPAE